MKKINTLKDYFDSVYKDKKASTNISLENSIKTEILDILPNLQVSKAVKFSEDVTSIVTSDNVIKSLSDRLGSPKENETEDDFVKRGRSILEDIIRKKIKRN